MQFFEEEERTAESSIERTWSDYLGPESGKVGMISNHKLSGDYYGHFRNR